MANSTTTHRTVMLTLSNYPEWRRKMLNEALDYGAAGRGLQTGDLEPMDIPTFEQLDEDGNRVYANTGVGNALFLAEKKYAEDHYRELSQTSQKLLSKILKSWDSEVEDRVISNEGYEALRDQLDLLGIWNLLQELIFTDANGVFTVSNASDAFTELEQGDKTFDSFVIDLRRIVKAMNDFGAPIPEILISSKLLNSMNCREIPAVISQHATYSTTTPSPTTAVMIPKFQRLFLADASTSKRGRRNKKIRNEYKSEQAQQPQRQPDQVRAMVSVDISDVDKKRALNECTNCTRTGHFMNECLKPKVTCNICHKQGHRDAYCRQKVNLMNSNTNNKHNNNNNSHRRPNGRNVAMYTNDNHVSFMCIDSDTEVKDFIAVDNNDVEVYTEIKDCIAEKINDVEVNNNNEVNYQDIIPTHSNERKRRLLCDKCGMDNHDTNECTTYPYYMHGRSHSILTKKKEDDFWDIFGDDIVSEYESDDHFEILQDSSHTPQTIINCDIIAHINDNCLHNDVSVTDNIIKLRKKN